jgi:hypothetical protein
MRFPLLDHKPALIRAFYLTTLGSTNPNAWRHMTPETSWIKKARFLTVLQSFPALTPAEQVRLLPPQPLLHGQDIRRFLHH